MVQRREMRPDHDILQDEDVGLLRMLSSRVAQLSGAPDVGIVLGASGPSRIALASTLRAHRLTRLQLEHADGPVHDCQLHVRSVLSVTIAQFEARWPCFVRSARAAGFRSVLAVPLQARGTTIGALNLFTISSIADAPRLLRTVEALADLAAIGLTERRTVLHLRTHIAQLEHALHSRIVIEQAKGMLAAQSRIPVDRAFTLLRDHCRNNNRRLHDVAQDIIAGHVNAHELAG